MYAKILVPVDGSQASTAGLREAIKIAKSQGSEIRLLHVVNDLFLSYGYGSGIYGSDGIEVLRKAGRSLLEAAEASARREGLKTSSALLESVAGPAAETILAVANAWPADLVVMGTHGRRGLARLVMGSDAEGVLRACPVPVLLVRGAAQESAVTQRAPAAAG